MLGFMFGISKLLHFHYYNSHERHYLHFDRRKNYLEVDGSPKVIQSRSVVELIPEVKFSDFYKNNE